MKIYTRGGDQGETSLLGGGRVRKNHERIEAYGTIDELNSFLGVARAAWPQGLIDEELARIQHDLFEIGAHLAANPGDSRFAGVSPERISAIEGAIDAMEQQLAPLTNFILPGGSQAAASLHIVRTICRRAERLIVALHDSTEAMISTLTYMNRLSDYLFVAARYANHSLGVTDVEWRR